MTTADKVIKTTVGVLELGKQLGNVSKACRIMGSAATVLSVQRVVRDGREAALAEISREQTESKEPDQASLLGRYPLRARTVAMVAPGLSSPLS